MPASVPLFLHFRWLKDPRIVGFTTYSLQTIRKRPAKTVLDRRGNFEVSLPETSTWFVCNVI